MSEYNKIENSYQFKVALKTYSQQGNLVYEYNPFHNYRLNSTMIFYQNRLMSIEEFCAIIGKTENDLKGLQSWDNIIPNSETKPIVYQKGELVDFETDELDFSLNNPVDIIPQWSYDNSTNLIINDGKNPPRLINSRFSVTKKNQYQVCNRKGTNDTNIYDQGDQFDIDTSLYKKMTTIPRLRFAGLIYGGNLSIGNYHFYFKYVDEDNNESDFFAESGLVSVFIGNSADSIYSGFRNENSHKQARFIISNTDASYTKIRIYYTKSTSDIYQNATTQTYKILKDYQINLGEENYIIISGYEDKQEVTIDDINLRYQIYGSVETQATAQNMLFLANVDKPKTEYEDLSDCALRFLPVLDCSENYNVNQIGINYTGSVTNTYYDPLYIYNKVGYWDDEIYRFGVVFIRSDNTLTEVFNVRGIKKLDNSITESSYTNKDFKDKDGNRVYISYQDSDYRIVEDSGTISDQNAKGVVLIQNSSFSTVIGINFILPQEVLEYLKNILKIKGFFFVRQKRIPTTLCQAYTIGIDKQSHTPLLPVKSEEDTVYITEGFLSTGKSFNKDADSSSLKERSLVHDFNQRVLTVEKQQVNFQGAICPDYDVNSPYLNSLFSASEMVCRNCSGEQMLKQQDESYFAPENFEFIKGSGYSSIKVIGVEDNVKLVTINDNMFSARAGEAEEAFRYEYVGEKNITKEATNLLRGSFGPYLGITGYDKVGHLIDIKIPGYNPSEIENYFLIRYNDKSPFYSISDRFDLENSDWWLNENKLRNPLYRGDCYICQFTHRINRNFQDPESPTNDEIVDEKCWADNFEVSDGVVKTQNFEKINLGDVNAVKMGMYVTLVVHSTMNLNIRALDDSQVDEASLFGHGRGFYPFYSMSNSGSYKIPEALCYNKGFEKSLSEKVNFEVADVPWIKNEFSNRIAYSNIQVQDAFQNGWRTFVGTHYRDYPKTYGSITKIVELRGTILCVFEHGVSLIPVNERAIAGEGQGGNVYINTSNVLPENPKVISDTFGSQWKESIIKTPIGVYGVDTVAKKIWRTNGEDFECISDFKISEFLNNNISLTERELTPIIGVRNVKSHYNAYKRDVMFTFYDNLYGFEEKVWNICFNESVGQWITFYSWVPSYSGNIYNSFFSFDRNTSKWIAKLGTSHFGSDFADGITLDDVIIKGNNFSSGLHLSNRTLPTGSGVTVNITYELEPDIYHNNDNFRIDNINKKLIFTGDYNSITSELYQRDNDGKILKDDKGRRIQLDNPINSNKLVILLNIRANISCTYNGVIPDKADAYLQGFANGLKVDAGYYQSVVALVPEYNLQFLTTDFWRHGQSGIIDIADKLCPTYWYGKQHPFEFEFIVADNPSLHKIFDNLEIISNNAEPESFHYEIIGDCYDFAKDKKNMYIRQEATKELYQANGFDVTYDHDYIDLTAIHRPLYEGAEIRNLYDKSTILPLYYSRQDTINEIEDYYHSKDNISTKDFSALSGGEIVKYNNLDEYRIWNHAKAVDMQKHGRLRGNMQYKEDKWYVQINPINVVYKNENQWGTEDLGKRQNLNSNKIPIEIEQSPIPDDVLNYDNGNIKIPENSRDRAIIKWNWEDSKMKEVKPKDKWIKIRVRYKGNKLAVISAIRTLYSISYS